MRAELIKGRGSAFLQALLSEQPWLHPALAADFPSGRYGVQYVVVVSESGRSGADDVKMSVFRRFFQVRGSGKNWPAYKGLLNLHSQL